MEEASYSSWALKYLGLNFDSTKSFVIFVAPYLVSFLMMNQLSLATFMANKSEYIMKFLKYVFTQKTGLKTEL